MERKDRHQHEPLRLSAEEQVRGKEREEGWGGDNG